MFSPYYRSPKFFPILSLTKNFPYCRSILSLPPSRSPKIPLLVAHQVAHLYFSIPSLHIIASYYRSHQVAHPKSRRHTVAATSSLPHYRCHTVAGRVAHTIAQPNLPYCRSPSHLAKSPVLSPIPKKVAHQVAHTDFLQSPLLSPTPSHLYYR